METSAQTWVKNLLSIAGVTVGGKEPWDIEVHDKRFYSRMFQGASLALGETYMEGWWDTPSLDQFFEKILEARLDEKVTSLEALFQYLKALFFNLQDETRAFQIGERHYDIGNDLYKAMLDTHLTYTCGYWKNAKTLDQAQENKLDLVCRKIGLKKGDYVLDIGCGWGSFAIFAAEKYGAKVLGITVSKEQALLGKELANRLPVEIRLQDYRKVEGQFDHIVSLGMFEHVGLKNYRTYMEIAAKLLKNDGLFLLHTIGDNLSRHAGDPWISKYIFPNGMLPSIPQIGKAIEGIFVMEDWHNFGADYDKTLMTWFENFNHAWPTLSKKYSEHFYRMWKYYLLSCAGTFRARRIELWQVILSKSGVKGGYQSVR